MKVRNDAASVNDCSAEGDIYSGQGPQRRLPVGPMGGALIADRIATVMMYAAVSVLGIAAGIVPRQVLWFLRRSISEVRPSLLQGFRIFAFIVGIIAVIGLVRVLTGYAP